MGDDIMVLNGQRIQIDGVDVEYQEFVRKKRRPWGEIVAYKALEGINLEIDSGEVVGVIGKNGSGKSTLLRAISGLLRPSKGKIITNGRVILLAGVNPGFIGSISGRQNVRELALAYGVEKEEVESFTASVERFADIGDAFERNMGGYSTGMRGKVGFGFITALDPGILLIDETLGVGDLEFRAKAMRRLRGFIERAGIVMISTHSLGLASEICTRGVVLEGGKVVEDGAITQAISHYRSSTVN